jgi:hypothetical protein
MPLNMRPTGLSSGKDTADYSVFCGEWCIGRICENQSGHKNGRWFWALNCLDKLEGLRTANLAPTLEGAKAEFEASWKQWKAWAGLEEVS